VADPTPHANSPSGRLIAPISTVLFVPNDYQGDSSPGSDDTGTDIPAETNISKDKHWTDMPAPGSIVLLQQPSGQIVALLGDIIATRFKVRGIVGAIVDGRMRDVAGCGELCADGKFSVWSKGLSTVGTSLEAKPWAVDIQIQVGGVTVRPGDFAVLDEAEKGIVVIPEEKLAEVAELLPGLKEADDAVLRDVRDGVDLKEAFQRHRGHYVHQK
jgi:regulator of RNase E activity RraA